MLSDSENENRERCSSHHRTSTVALIVASKKRRFAGTPKKSIALLSEPNLFASIGNLVDPYTNKPQHMVILGSATPKSTTSTRKARPPPRLIGSLAPCPSMVSEIPTVETPRYNEPFPEPYQSHYSHTRLQKNPKEPLFHQSQIKDTDEDSHQSILRRKQLKVYHKIPKRKKPQQVSLRSSPGQAVIDLAIDMITEFELLMTQVGIGPICVPKEKRRHKATTGSGSRARKREPSPPPLLDDDLTDLGTLNESNCSTAQGTNIYFPIHALRQPSHLSYTTILSGEVEVEMEASFDNSYDYVDDITYEERSDTESYEDDEDDDSSSVRNESVDTSHRFSKTIQSTNVPHDSRRLVDNSFFPLSLQNVFGKPWYGSSQSESTDDEAQCSQRSNYSVPVLEPCTRRITDPNGANRTLSIPGTKQNQSVPGTSGDNALVHCHVGDTTERRYVETMACLEQKPINSSEREKEKPWVMSMLDPLLTHVFACSSNLDDPRHSTSYCLRLGAGDSTMLGHQQAVSTARDPGNGCFDADRSTRETYGTLLSSKPGNNNGMHASRQEDIVPGEATEFPRWIHPASGPARSGRVPQWEKLLAALSLDTMDDPGRRHVTFSPSVLGNHDKTASTGSKSRKEMDLAEKPVQPRHRGRLWPRWR